MKSAMQGFIFHHLGVAVPDMKVAIPSFEALFNYRLVSGPFDDPIQRVSVSFLSRGEDDTVIELVAPLGSDSPIRAILKKGIATYHVCYEVPDLKAAIEHMTGQGCHIISEPVPAVAFNQRLIAWLMTETNFLVELLEA